MFITQLSIVCLLHLDIFICLLGDVSDEEFDFNLHKMFLIDLMVDICYDS